MFSGSRLGIKCVFIRLRSQIQVVFLSLNSGLEASHSGYVSGLPIWDFLGPESLMPNAKSELAAFLMIDFFLFTQISFGPSC